jgi:DNA repair protein RadA/Sms
MEEISLRGDWLFLGELALTGEVRRAPLMDIRIAEAKKLGFTTVVIPENTPKKVIAGAGIQIQTVSRVRDLAKLLT